MLDSVRASTFLAEKMNGNIDALNVRVIGGHSGKTIIPLISQVPNCTLNDTEIAELTHRIQFAGDEVVAAKEGRGSATLSMVQLSYACRKTKNFICKLSCHEGICW